METSVEPHRCPKCDALVVDRRSFACTTCGVNLPPGWAFTPEQALKLEESSLHAQQEHAVAMGQLDSTDAPANIDTTITPEDQTS